MLNKLPKSFRRIVQIDPIYSILFLGAFLCLCFLVATAIFLNVEGFGGNVAAEMVGFLLDVMFLCAVIFYYEASKAASRDKKLVANIVKLCRSSFPFGYAGKLDIQRQYARPAQDARKLLEPLLPVVIGISAGHYRVYVAILSVLDALATAQDKDSARHSTEELTKLLRVFEAIDPTKHDGDTLLDAQKELSVLAWSAYQAERQRDSSNSPEANPAVNTDAAR